MMQFIQLCDNGIQMIQTGNCRSQGKVASCTNAQRIKQTNAYNHEKYVWVACAEAVLEQVCCVITVSGSKLIQQIFSGASITFCNELIKGVMVCIISKEN